MYTLTYIYTSLYQIKQSLLLSYVFVLESNECKTLRLIYSISLVFHKACVESHNSQ